MVRTVAARANRPRRNFSRPPSGRAAPVPAAAGRRSAARRSPRPLLHPHHSFARRNRSQRRRIEPSRSPHQARMSRCGSADSSRRRLRPALSDLRAASPTFIPPPRPPPRLPRPPPGVRRQRRQRGAGAARGAAPRHHQPRRGARRIRATRPASPAPSPSPCLPRRARRHRRPAGVRRFARKVISAFFFSFFSGYKHL